MPFHRGINAIQEPLQADGNDFILDEKLGYINSSPKNIGTGMRASIKVELPGWKKSQGIGPLELKCEELNVDVVARTKPKKSNETGTYSTTSMIYIVLDLRFIITVLKPHYIFRDPPPLPIYDIYIYIYI